MDLIKNLLVYIELVKYAKSQFFSRFSSPVQFCFRAFLFNMKWLSVPEVVTRFLSSRQVAGDEVDLISEPFSASSWWHAITSQTDPHQRQKSFLMKTLKWKKSSLFFINPFYGPSSLLSWWTRIGLCKEILHTKQETRILQLTQLFLSSGT